MSDIVLIILSLLVLLFIGVIYLFFHMRALREQGMNSWFALMERLNVRLDKIPNLIETLRRLTQGQEKLFQALIDVRERTWPLDMPDRERVHAELEVAGKLHECWELAHTFADLKKDTNWLELRSEFKEIDGEVEELTNAYNERARHYNKAREFVLFQPLTLILGFRRMPVLEFE